MNKKQIVIAGSGFGGIHAALELSKRVDHAEVDIVLVDRHPYHLAHAFLYEVASSPEELTSLSQLKQSVVIPIDEVIAGTGIRFQQASLQSIDTTAREVLLDHGKLPYDYLVLALGSDPNFYGILGADQYAIPLKSIRDSFAIRNKIDFLLQSHRLDMTKQLLRIVVAGGGFAGVEMAAELKGMLDFLAWKNQYPREKLEVMVVEGANQLMPGLGDEVGRDVYTRLKKLGTEIRINSLITKVDEKYLEFNNGEKLEHDCLIWTAGVKARHVPMTGDIELDKSGRIMTDGNLRSTKRSNIFAVGDQTCFLDPTGRPLPGTARQAIDQGTYIGCALAELVKNRQPKPYQCKSFGYIVPLGGRWAIFKSSQFYFKGFLPYLLRQVAWFHYFYTILGLRRAISLSILENRLYGRND